MFSSTSNHQDNANENASHNLAITTEEGTWHSDPVLVKLWNAKNKQEEFDIPTRLVSRTYSFKG